MSLFTETKVRQVLIDYTTMNLKVTTLTDVINSANGVIEATSRKDVRVLKGDTATAYELELKELVTLLWDE